MKNIILDTFVSCFLLTVASNVLATTTTTKPESVGLGLTETDIYPQLNSQDRASYDKLDAQQRAFVVRMINSAPEMQISMGHGMNQGGGMMGQGQGGMRGQEGMGGGQGRMMGQQGMGGQGGMRESGGQGRMYDQGGMRGSGGQGRMMGEEGMGGQGGMMGE